MSWRWCSVVLRHVSNASVAMSGSSSRSVGEMPLRVRMGSPVVGETVVMTSTDMVAVYFWVEFSSILVRMQIQRGTHGGATSIIPSLPGLQQLPSPPAPLMDGPWPADCRHRARDADKIGWSTGVWTRRWRYLGVLAMAHLEVEIARVFSAISIKLRFERIQNLFVGSKPS